ncbi:MAG: hypothetical protein BAJALOKI2v1_100067 [Promethearchaeota archaeon]|nr:MAG: hypothetical protein BAJALOKI2v1_100067 [Candidatus Lokiarchaeota archaeon]
MLKIAKNDSKICKITNGLISIIFHKQGSKKGTYSISFEQKTAKRDKTSLKNCFFRINYYSKESKKLEELNSKSYSFNCKVQKFNDEIGNGFLIFFSPFELNQINVQFKITFRLYDKKKFILVKITDIRDNSKIPLRIHSISPLTIKDSKIFLSKNNCATKLDKISWFKNGWQSWSACKTLFGEEKDNKGPSNDLLFLLLDNQDYMIEGRFYSEYCSVITDLESHKSLILGFTTFKDQFSRIVLDYENFSTVKLLTAFGCMDGVTFKENSIDCSEELFISFKNNGMGYYGLEEYAEVVSLRNGINSQKKIPSGWCSWYYYFTTISQEETLKNLEYLKEHRELLPIEFFQLDDGYFTKIGDYKSFNSKFSKGLKWLFKKIRDSRFKTGLWTAPFIGVRRSELFKRHKEWFLKDIQTKKLLKVLWNWGSFEYALDISRKEVIDYLRGLFRDKMYVFERETTKNDLQLLDFAKIDFLYAVCAINSDYSDKSLTRAQIYYNAVKLIRETISENTFLLGCGAPLGPCVGLVDAMRIGQDTGPTWIDNKVIDEFSDKCLKTGMINVLFRSFMHKRFWINDPDCLMVRRTNTDLNLDEIRLQMTLFGLSGGLLLFSEDMINLSEKEINDLRLMIPPYNPKNHHAIPVDILNSKTPYIYTLETTEVFGKRYLVCIINWEDVPRNIVFKPSNSLPFIPEKEQAFYIYDFWENSFLGEFKREEPIIFDDVNPHSCKYLSVIPINAELKDKPIVISSNLHISQGCYEVNFFQYIRSKNRIKINLSLPGKRKGFIYIKLPNKTYILDYNGKSEPKKIKFNIWKVPVEFKDNATIKIKIQRKEK